MKRAILQIFTAFLVLGLFCGAATAVPSINGVISPSNSTVTGTVGATQQFTIPLNETATVIWTENGINRPPTQTDSNNVTTISHVFQSGSYQVTATLQGAEQIAKWDVVGTTGVPVITLSDPSSSSVNTNIGESKTFTATVSQTSDFVWTLDGTSC